jgi:hypothetical protein
LTVTKATMHINRKSGELFDFMPAAIEKLIISKH